MINKQTILSKKWDKEEIINTLTILEHAPKSSKIKFLEDIVFWLALMMSIAGNLVIAIALIPILVSLNGPALYVIVIAIAMSFGFLVELLIRSIEHLEHRHHLMFGISIPLIASATMISIVSFANSIETTIPLQNSHNPFLIAIVYAISFIIPYTFYQLVLKPAR